jgi:hypothetical protein
MLPNNVGEWKKLLADLPDDMTFSLNVEGDGSVYETRLECQENLVLTVVVTAD